MMASDRTKKIEESKVDPDEDIMTRGIRGAMRGVALGASKAGDALKSGADTVADDVHMMLGTKRGKMKEEELQKKYDRPGYNRDQAEKAEAAATLKRESRGMKKGGVVKSSASKRADGVATKGKTKGRMV
jgi:hypothetical protein